MSDAQPDLTTTSGKLADLRARLAEAQAPRGEEAAEAVRQAGRATARERVLALLDPNSFVETDALAKHRITEFGLDRDTPLTDGVVTGYGTVDGRRVCVFSQDDQIFDGALGEVYGEKILKIYDLAVKTGVPVVSINSARGARVAEGLAGLSLYAKIYQAASLASGIVPQIAVVAGANVGVSALAPHFADIVVHVDGATSHVAEADVVTQVTGEEVSELDLGGSDVQQSTGQAHLTAASDVDALAGVREILGFLPVNNLAEAPRPGEPITGNVAETVTDAERALDGFMPDSDAQPYDVVDVITPLIDGGDLHQLHEHYATNMVTGFARIEGRAVGVVANQPSVLAGCLDTRAAAKAARFIRMCDAFNLPVVSFVDCPGVVPSKEQETAGIGRAAAQLTFAFAEATVGKLSVITRKAIGTAYVAMGAKDTGTDLVYAWPTAQIAVADAPAAARALYGDDADTHAGDWAAEHLTPYRAAETGLVDAVIEPSTTRVKLVEGLRLLDRKVIARRPRKHDNIPLA